MRRLIAVAACSRWPLATSTIAWGYEAHKAIMDAAIASLPAELRPLFEQNRATLVERSIDPDTWQVAGFDAPGVAASFLDLDWDGYGDVPASRACLAITPQRSPSSASSASSRTGRCRGASRRCTATCARLESHTRGPTGVSTCSSRRSRTT